MKTDLSKVDCRLAIMDEPPPSGEAVYIRCSNPKHTDKNASCAVYPDHIHCFVCGFHIAYRMESLAHLLKIDVREAFKRARYYTTEGLDAYRERAAIEARKDPLPPSVAQGYNRILWESRYERMSWYYSRGIKSEWIDLMKLGHTGEKFSIPIWDKDGKLLNIRFRRDDEYYIAPDEGERPAPKYSGMKGRNGTYFYPERLFHGWAYGSTTSVVGLGEWCVVCEGELDALRLWVEGIPAISPTNGANSVKQVVEFLKQYPRIKRIYIATDQDAAGDKAAQEFMSLAQGYDVVERLIWGGAKDVTELYQSGGELCSAFSFPDLS